MGIQPPTFRHAQTKNNFSLMFFSVNPVNLRPSHSVRDSLNQSNNPCFVHRTMNRLPFSPSIPPPFNFHMNPQTRYRPKIKFELKDHDNPTCENFRLLFTVGGEVRSRKRRSKHRDKYEDTGFFQKNNLILARTPRHTLPPNFNVACKQSLTKPSNKLSRQEAPNSVGVGG